MSDNSIEHTLITEYAYKAKKPAQLIFSIEDKIYALTIEPIMDDEINKLQIHELGKPKVFEGNQNE